MIKNKLCKCGCKLKIKDKPHHKWYGVPDYIWGHNINKGLRFKKGHIPHNKGLKMPERCGDNNPAKRPEVREKLRQKMKERLEKYGPMRGMLGKHHSKKTKRNLSKLHMGENNSNYGKHTWNYGLTKETDKRVNNISKNQIGKKRTKKSINKGIVTKLKRGMFKKHSEFMKLRWANKEFKENQIKKWIKGCRLKPNKKERVLDNIIQNNFPNRFILNVEGNVIINGKIPDWVDCNKQKRVILFNGVYWHLSRLQEKNPNLTKELVEKIEREPYTKVGFKVFYIWEDELNDVNKLKQKIRRWI